MPAVQSALVVGGGIAGPVAATALSMSGIDTVVCEGRGADAASANGIGGSLALEPNGLAALRIIDCDDAVRAAAVPITRSVMSIGNNRAGRCLHRMAFRPASSSIAAPCTAFCVIARSAPVCELNTARS